MKLKEYVYFHLKKDGNTIIDYKLYKKYGEKKILNELKKKGFNCIIKVVDHNDDITDRYKITKGVDKEALIDVIIEVVK